MLDRIAALELLSWGKDGLLPNGYSLEQQSQKINSLKNILVLQGYNLKMGGANIFVERGKQLPPPPAASVRAKYQSL